MFPPWTPNPAPGESEPEFVFEPDPEAQFRAEQLEEAGYTSENAWLLATHEEVDWHKAVALLEQGCDEVTAVQILL